MTEPLFYHEQNKRIDNILIEYYKNNPITDIIIEILNTTPREYEIYPKTTPIS